MLEGKGLIEDTDMPLKMQIQAMTSASQALDLHDVLDCKSIAGHIKKEFDKRYGNGWQCGIKLRVLLHTYYWNIHLFHARDSQFPHLQRGCLRVPSSIWLKENEQRHTHWKKKYILPLVT